MKEKELIAIMASNLYHGIPYNGYSSQVDDAIRLAIWILERVEKPSERVARDAKEANEHTSILLLNEDGVVVPLD